ncbi:ATP-binding protein, partial [Candidatus Woesearchaeota archaeon]|nr:ATP-binding protein [Candidatus Woesearchaeota archaeon]
GSKEMDFNIFLQGRDVLSHHVLIPASTGKGKSNLMSCILWEILNHDYAGMLVLDPHDEYYGRTELGLKDHPNKDRVSYYTPSTPPVGARSLKINLSKLKPEHLQGATSLSDPQRQCLYAYYRKFKELWIRSLFEERKIEQVNFHEDTISVVKRKLISLLNLDFENNQLYCKGIFDETAGENTISEICQDLEQGKIVIIDTSFFSGAIEILVGSLITTEIFEKYKYYKKTGILNDKPVISVVLEEAPRVLGKKVLEQGSNIFDTLAREGRKFKVGLIAITQLPSEIPKNILANMNTKIILGIEMNSERQAIIESSPQDLSQDNRNIAALDKGEALVTSTFTRFAVPIKIPLFEEFAQKEDKEKNQQKLDFSNFS